jgi:hypothetical protein
MDPVNLSGDFSGDLTPEDLAKLKWIAVNGSSEEAQPKEPQKKYFLVSKGFLGGLWAVLFGLGVTCAEIVGVPAWSLEHWPQLIKVLGAGLGTLAAAYGLYGRVVADAPIKFVLGE